MPKKLTSTGHAEALPQDARALDAISRQMQALVEKLEYKADDDDFSMQYYVPFLKKIALADAAREAGLEF